MRAFITGRTGFIGQNSIRRPHDRGYKARALARSPQITKSMSAMGVDVVRGDVTDPAFMREAKRDCDIVLHMAGYADIGEPDSGKMEIMNVGGTCKVLRLAQELEQIRTGEQLAGVLTFLTAGILSLS